MKTQTTNANLNQVNYTPRFIALTVLAIVLLCAITRPHGQSAQRPSTDPAGIYALVSVDGKTVPCSINHEGTAMNIQSGTFAITTNSQITSVITISVGDRKNIRCETHATYKAKGPEFTMKWQNAGMTKGRLVGQIFTMTNEGMAYVYKRN